LKLYFIHTKEKAEITFKRNGRYDQAGLRQINNFLRDWRRNEPTKMDPLLLDLVWETYRAVGARDYIHVVSAYRSPATNSMLRSRSNGVANKSQHMLGKAMDFYIPGVSLKALRDTGLKMQTGGVGYYPRSGSPFVHLDVGNVRHWPRMSRQELVSVFPHGNTLHVPSDGKPLPGFETALASYQARKKNGGTALALASSGKSRSGGLLAAIFGGGADEEEESGGAVEAVASAPAKATRPAKPEREVAAPGKIQVIPPELATPANIQRPAEAESPGEETPEAIIAALPARSIPLPAFAPRPTAEIGEGVPFGMAEAAPAAPAPVDLAARMEVAANVPLPTWRPDYAPTSKEADLAAEDAKVILALAAPDDVVRPAAKAIPLPQSRPSDAGVAVAALSDTVPGMAGVPESRPPDAALTVAALSETVPSMTGLLEMGPSLVEKAEAAEAVEAEIKANNQRLATLAARAASPKDVVAARPKGVDATAVIGAGAKTTPKSARAKIQDTKPDPKPQVIAVQPESTRWALYSGTYVPSSASGAPKESVARLIVRSAPSEVYATGFQQGAEVADAGRFTGKAVSFMPVARFATN
jgi:uncharacterized protein YcbK (DUF882 family)